MSSLFPFTAELRDGTSIIIREIGPNDRCLLREGFAQLSQKSRFMRFLAAHGDLTEDELDNFTTLNTADHFAIGAISDAGPLATARFVRTADSQKAEIAITIIDTWQRRGLGSLLLQTLMDAARARGITDLIALVHPENSAMRNLLDRFDARMVGNNRGEMEFEIALELEPARKIA